MLYRELRRRLREYDAYGELVRVYLKGRREMRGAVSFVGYPKVVGSAVTLYGTDALPRATVELRKIAAVQRVKADRPVKPHEQAPTANVTATSVPAESAKRGVIRATFELDTAEAEARLDRLAEKQREIQAHLRGYR